MTCRIFRELKLGQFADPVTEVALSTIVHQDMDNISPQQRYACELRDVNTDMDTGGNGMPDTRDVENPSTGDIATQGSVAVE
jgi:hypothetical protein